MKEIVIAVTGSIAAYKTCELIRNLKKDNLPVKVIMSHNATKFIGKITFEALTGNSVMVDKFESGMPHIEVKNFASVFAVIPATANTIGKMAHGIAGDLLTSTYLAANCPVVIAPAMNPGMYSKKVVQRNIELLKNDGVIVLDSQKGVVICGDEGYGKMADISEIQKILTQLHQKNS